MTNFSCDEGLLSPSNNNELSEEQVVKGLKQALKTGSERAVDTLNQEGGYLKDNAVKITLPPEVSDVTDEIPDRFLQPLVKEMNRAAEDAANKAAPIFVNAITNIRFQDARNILEGTDTAATNYFRKNTRSELFSAFKPDMKNSLEKVGAQQTWSDLTSTYNQIPFRDDIQTNLADYATNRALEGLFVKLKNEEKRVREDPQARTLDILKTVFSKVGN